jgi:hypothetical protein
MPKKGMQKRKQGKKFGEIIPGRRMLWMDVSWCVFKRICESRGLKDDSVEDDDNFRRINDKWWSDFAYCDHSLARSVRYTSSGKEVFDYEKYKESLGMFLWDKIEKIIELYSPNLSDLSEILNPNQSILSNPPTLLNQPINQSINQPINPNPSPPLRFRNSSIHFNTLVPVSIPVPEEGKKNINVDELIKMQKEKIVESVEKKDYKPFAEFYNYINDVYLELGRMSIKNSKEQHNFREIGDDLCEKNRLIGTLVRNSEKIKEHLKSQYTTQIKSQGIDELYQYIKDCEMKDCQPKSPVHQTQIQTQTQTQNQNQNQNQNQDPNQNQNQPIQLVQQTPIQQPIQNNQQIQIQTQTQTQIQNNQQTQIQQPIQQTQAQIQNNQEDKNFEIY